MDGTADLAFIATGYVPNEFPDTSVMELPGLFENEREASLVFTRLIEAGALAGYDRFFVPGAFVSSGENIHSRKPTGRLTDLRGQTIRVNNVIEASTLRLLGARPVLLPINRTMDALSKGELDGTTVPPAMVFEFGFGRLTENHFLLELGGAPSVLVMNRDKLASLPARAQQIIRKYSGEWLAKRESACFAAKNHDVIAQLKAAPQRKVVVHSEADLAAVRDVYAGVVQAWADESPHNRDLLALLRSEIDKLRKETPR
jgi:TRAP-type C4-dicarboxylate transport system substrate-binding protein